MKKVALFLGLSEDATEEQIVNALQAKDADHNKAVQKILMDTAAKFGAITEENRANIEKLAGMDAELALSFLPVSVKPQEKEEKEYKPVSGKQSLVDAIKEANAGKKADEGKKDAKSDWTLTDWEQKDPNGLKKILSDDPEKYQGLFEAKHGIKLSLEDIKKYI